MPSVKLVSFNDRTGPFQIIARYAKTPDLPPYANPILGRFLVSGMPSTADGKPPKIKVRVKLDTHGCLQVTSAQMLIEEIAEQPQPSQAEDKMDTSVADGNSQKETKTTTGAGIETPPVNEAEKMDTSGDNATAQKVQQSQSSKEDAKPKTRTRREDLKVEPILTAGATNQQLSAWLERETAMSLQVSYDSMHCILIDKV